MRVPVWRPRGRLSTPPTWTPLRGQDQTLGDSWEVHGTQTGYRGWKRVAGEKPPEGTHLLFTPFTAIHVVA